MNRRDRPPFSGLICILLLLVLFPCTAFAWPSDAQWIPVYKGGVFLQDPAGDTQGARNIVGDPANDAAFLFNDGTYIFFRLRLDENPAGVGGQGLLKAFGWGVEIDANINASDYEWLMMVDGISKSEVIVLEQNTVQGTLGDPSDASESICASILLAGNFQINPADTAFNGDQDYFLDWRFPYTTFKQCTGLTDNSPLRLFFGSSPSTNSLTEQGGDLVGGSDLYAGFSDFVTPLGTVPTTGTVRFVAGLLSNRDTERATAGQVLYLRVEDADQNWDSTALQSVSVTLTTADGESETLVLTETGADTGIFSAAVATAQAAPAAGNGIVETDSPDTVVTAVYNDAIDAGLNLNQPRVDTLTLLLAPALSVQKTAAPVAVAAGAKVTYTITISNSGQGEAFLTQIRDVLPEGFSYQAGSVDGLTTDDPAINGSILTWTGSWAVPRQTDTVDGKLSLSFDVSAGNLSGTFYNNVSVSGSNFAVVTSGDVAPVAITAPLMNLTKSASRASGVPGEKILYAVHYRNLGDGEAHTLIVMDTVPPNSTYIDGSLQIGPAGGGYDDPTNTVLTDDAGDDAGEINGSNVIFTIGLVAPDDGVPNSGPDEGVVYFKVQIN